MARPCAPPEFEKLQKAVFMGDVETVVVWKLDRLSRSLRDGINVLAECFGLSPGGAVPS